MEVAHPTQLPESSLRTQGRPARGRKRNLLGWYSLSLLFGYVLANTFLSYEDGGVTRQETFSQLPLFFVFCFLWFRHLGANLASAVFGWLALLPAVLVEGAGYIFFPGMALTPSDLLGVVGLFIWLRDRHPLRLKPFTRLAWVLLGVCLVSVLLTLNLGYRGQVARLVLQVLLVTAIFSAPGTASTKAFVDGICAWPVVALAYLYGIGQAGRFFTFGGGDALVAQASKEVLYGSHQVVTLLLPLMALALNKGAGWLAGTIFFGLLPYLVLAQSRSLITALGTVFLLTLIRASQKKAGLLVGLGGALLLAPVTFLAIKELGYFEFGEGIKEASTQTRFAKMAKAHQTFRENPLFGIGYGSVGILDSRNDVDISFEDSRFFENAEDKKASAEFTPFQILAETGVLGGLLSLWLISIAGLHWWRCMGSARVPAYVKTALVAWAVYFLVGFLGSNSFGTLIFMLAVPVAAFQAYCKAPASVPRIMGAQRLSSSAAIRAAKS